MYSANFKYYVWLILIACFVQFMAGKVWAFHAEHTTHTADNSNIALGFGEQEVTIGKAMWPFYGVHEKIISF